MIHDGGAGTAGRCGWMCQTNMCNLVVRKGGCYLFSSGRSPSSEILRGNGAGGGTHTPTAHKRITAFDPTMASPMCVGTSILDTGARKASVAGPAEAQAGVPGMFGLPNVANVSMLLSLSCSVCQLLRRQTTVAVRVCHLVQSAWDQSESKCEKC